MDANAATLIRAKKKLRYFQGANDQGLLPKIKDVFSLQDVDDLFDDLDSVSDSGLPLLSPLPKSSAASSLGRGDAPPAGNGDLQTAGGAEESEDAESPSPSEGDPAVAGSSFAVLAPVRTSSPIQPETDSSWGEERPQTRPLLLGVGEDEPIERDMMKPLSSQKPEADKELSSVGNDDRPSPPATPELSEGPQSTVEKIAPLGMGTEPAVPHIQGVAVNADQAPAENDPSETRVSEGASNVEVKHSFFQQKLHEALQPKPVEIRVVPALPPSPPLLDEDFLILEDDAPALFRIPWKNSGSQRDGSGEATPAGHGDMAEQKPKRGGDSDTTPPAALRQNGSVSQQPQPTASPVKQRRTSATATAVTDKTQKPASKPGKKSVEPFSCNAAQNPSEPKPKKKIRNPRSAQKTGVMDSECCAPTELRDTSKRRGGGGENTKRGGGGERPVTEEVELEVGSVREEVEVGQIRGGGGRGGTSKRGGGGRGGTSKRGGGGRGGTSKRGGGDGTSKRGGGDGTSKRGGGGTAQRHRNQRSKQNESAMHHGTPPEQRLESGISAADVAVARQLLPHTQTHSETTSGDGMMSSAGAVPTDPVQGAGSEGSVAGRRRRGRPGAWWLITQERVKAAEPQAATPISTGQPIAKQGRRGAAASRGTAESVQPESRAKRKPALTSTKTSKRQTSALTGTNSRQKPTLQTETRNGREEDLGQLSPLTRSPHVEHSFSPGDKRVFDVVHSRDPPVVAPSVPEKRQRTAPGSWWLLPQEAEHPPIPQPHPQTLTKPRPRQPGALRPAEMSDKPSYRKIGQLDTLRSRKNSKSQKTLKPVILTTPQTLKASMATFGAIFTSGKAQRSLGKNQARKNLLHSLEEPSVQSDKNTPEPSQCPDSNKVLDHTDTLEHGVPDASSVTMEPFRTGMRNSGRLSGGSTAEQPFDHVGLGLKSGPSSMLELDRFEEEEEDQGLPSSRVTMSVRQIPHALCEIDLCGPPLRPMTLQAEDWQNLALWFTHLWPASTSNGGQLVSPDHFHWYSHAGRALGHKLDLQCSSFSSGKILLGSYMKRPLQVDPYTVSVFNLMTGCVRVAVDGLKSIYNPGQTFMVPCGHAYSIQNLCQEPALLWYHRMVAEPPSD